MTVKLALCVHVSHEIEFKQKCHFLDKISYDQTDAFFDAI